MQSRTAPSSHYHFALASVLDMAGVCRAGGQKWFVSALMDFLARRAAIGIAARTGNIAVATVPARDRTPSTRPSRRAVFVILGSLESDATFAQLSFVKATVLGMDSVAHLSMAPVHVRAILDLSGRHATWFPNHFARIRAVDMAAVIR